MCSPEQFMKMSLLVLVSLGLAEACIPREVKIFPLTTPTTKPPRKKNKWNILKCAYMMLTFLFVSYNKGDWCYCHYCSTEVNMRNDPCCAF
ncbi:epididymal protein 13 [Rhynchonycteris naso]